MSKAFILCRKKYLLGIRRFSSYPFNFLYECVCIEQGRPRLCRFLDKGLDADIAAAVTAKVEGAVALVPNDNAKETLRTKRDEGGNVCQERATCCATPCPAMSIFPRGRFPSGFTNSTLSRINASGILISRLRARMRPLTYCASGSRYFRQAAYGALGKKSPSQAAAPSRSPAQGVVGSKPREWKHLLFTWRKHAMAMYVNGALAEAVDNVDFMFLHPPDSFTLGRPANPQLTRTVSIRASIC